MVLPFGITHKHFWIIHKIINRKVYIFMKKTKVNKKNNLNNMEFFDVNTLNVLTFDDYLDRLRKLAISIFEWVNLPPSMDARKLEIDLFYDGHATLLYDKKYGFINTRCSPSNSFNIYGLPTNFNCYSYSYQSFRKLYSGLISNSYNDDKECILVMNNQDRIPTAPTLRLFAYRLFESERSCDVNIKLQKFPLLLICDEKQRLMIENLYTQIDGNNHAIFGDKYQLEDFQLRSINTEAPFVADKLMEYKKEIWNEALTFLGINNVIVDKKERLITDEANSNNELINLNLLSYLIPRQHACEQFNEKFGLKGTDNEISVRVRSDLHNIIKNTQSIVASNIPVESGVQNYG